MVLGFLAQGGEKPKPAVTGLTSEDVDTTAASAMSVAARLQDDLSDRSRRDPLLNKILRAAFPGAQSDPPEDDGLAQEVVLQQRGIISMLANLALQQKRSPAAAGGAPEELRYTALAVRAWLQRAPDGTPEYAAFLRQFTERAHRHIQPGCVARPPLRLGADPDAWAPEVRRAVQCAAMVLVTDPEQFVMPHTTPAGIVFKAAPAAP